MTDDASPENLRKFLESDDPAMVRMGISLAKGADVEVTVKDFERFLKSKDVETVKTGVMLADEVGIGDEAMEMLCEVLGDEDLDNISYADECQPVAEVLGNIGDVRAVEPLIDALGDESMMEDRGGGEDARGAIAKALGKIGDQRAVEPLIDALFYGKGLYFPDYGRAEAAWALGEIGNARAVGPLIKLCSITDEEEDPDGYDEDRRANAIHQNIAEALEKIGKPAVALLIQTLRHEDVEFLFEEYNDWDLDEAITNGYYNPSDVRSFAAYTLGEIGGTRAVKPLIKALGDDNSKVRDAANDALKKLGHEVE